MNTKKKINTSKEVTNEIQQMIEGFCKEYLDEEYSCFCNNLLFTLNDAANLERGRKENWAAGVVYAIARVNFLFDSDSKYKLNGKIICEYFQTKKNTISNKATYISYLCNVDLGDSRFCNQEIMDLFTLIETDEAMIMSLGLLNNITTLDIMSEEDFEMFQREEEEKRLKKEEEMIRQQEELELQRIKRKKEKEKAAGQIFLFDDIE